MLPIHMGNQHRYLAYMDRFWFKWMKQLIFVSDLLTKNYTNLAYNFIKKDQFHYPIHEFQLLDISYGLFFFFITRFDLIFLQVQTQFCVALRTSHVYFIITPVIYNILKPLNRKLFCGKHVVLTFLFYFL